VCVSQEVAAEGWCPVWGMELPEDGVPVRQMHGPSSHVKGMSCVKMQCGVCV